MFSQKKTSSSRTLEELLKSYIIHSENDFLVACLQFFCTFFSCDCYICYSSIPMLLAATADVYQVWFIMVNYGHFIVSPLTG